MTSAAAYAIALAAALVAGWLVPALGMRLLLPSLEASGQDRANYRGRRVVLGLGAVWAIWGTALLATGALVDAVGMPVLAKSVSYGSVEMALFDGPLTVPLYAVPIILTLAALLFGMLDDVFGTHADKGFRGHVRALLGGRLTTGGLKLLGIGVVAAVYGWHAADRAATAYGEVSAGVLVLWWVAATLVIALSANFVNLTDLRPGRALKTYGVLAAGAGVLFALEAVGRYRDAIAGTGGQWGAADTTVTIACMLVVLLGPVAAVWRYDLGERGMLGDAGSNAMGAIVGYLLAGSLSLPWLTATAVVLLAANALSERVSFSSLIEAAPPLRFLDHLGRLPDEGSGGG